MHHTINVPTLEAFIALRRKLIRPLQGGALWERLSLGEIKLQLPTTGDGCMHG